MLTDQGLDPLNYKECKGSRTLQPDWIIYQASSAGAWSTEKLRWKASQCGMCKLHPARRSTPELTACKTGGRAACFGKGTAISPAASSALVTPALHGVQPFPQPSCPGTKPHPSCLPGPRSRLAPSLLQAQGPQVPKGKPVCAALGPGSSALGVVGPGPLLSHPVQGADGACQALRPSLCCSLEGRRQEKSQLAQSLRLAGAGQSSIHL